MHIGLLAADLTHQHGWAHYSLSLIHALHRAGLSMTVLTTVNSAGLELDGIEVLPILPTVDPMGRGMLPQLVSALPRAIRALKGCDLIHALIEPYAPLAMWVAGARPLFITGHGSYVRVNDAYRSPFNRLYAAAFRRSQLICVSGYTTRAAQTAIPGVRTTVIPNGVDVERFAHLPAVPKTGRTVLTVAAIKPRKGTFHLVRAMAAVRDHFPDARCEIVGSATIDRAYVDQVRAEIATLDLTDAVSLRGRVSDAELLSAFASADVFAMPSMNDGWKFEGFGLSLLEASAAGLPVIGTHDCGAEDAVDDGVTGLLVDQAGIDRELPAAIIRLLEDADLRAHMGAAGRAKASAHTWDDTARAVIDVYQRKK